MTETSGSSGPARRMEPHGPGCFGCGPENRSGLKLEVFRCEDEVRADIRFAQDHAGAHGVVHGGVLAAACDDLVAFLLYVHAVPAVTRSLTVEYLAPVPVGERHRLVGRLVEREGRRLLMEVEGTAEDGALRFRAGAVFVTVDLAHFERFGAALDEHTVARFRAASVTGVSPGEGLS